MYKIWLWFVCNMLREGFLQTCYVVAKVRELRETFASRDFFFIMVLAVRARTM